MKNKHFTFTIILLVVALFAGFFAGSYYKGSQTSSSSTSITRGATGSFTRGARTGGAGGVTGNIISKDSQSITIALPAGGSQIIFVNIDCTCSAHVNISTRVHFCTCAFI